MTAITACFHGLGVALGLIEDEVDVQTVHRVIKGEASEWSKKVDWLNTRQTSTGLFAQLYLDSLNPSGFALDLCSGVSDFADNLVVQKDYTVTAVDRSPKVMEIMRNYLSDRGYSKNGNIHTIYGSTGTLELVEEEVESYQFPEEVDLIYAYDAFPYINPEKFEAVWKRALVSLKEGGLLIGNFYHHPQEGAWVVPNRMHVVALLKEEGDDYTCDYDRIWGSQTIHFVLRKGSTHPKGL